MTPEGADEHPPGESAPGKSATGRHTEQREGEPGAGEQGVGAVLRGMTFDDLSVVMALERATFPADAWSEGMMRGELADQPRTRHYLVAVVDDVIVGYAGLAAAGDQADVQTIAVLPAFRRLGIGGALLSDLIAEARRRGAVSIFLEVRADNPSAQRMYERFGFERIGVRRSYYDDGTDALTMMRKLDG